MSWVDRPHAGRALATRLLADASLGLATDDPNRPGDVNDPNHVGGVVVLGLPRGGVPVAFEVAQALGAPLDVIVVRKLGLPSQPELALGAIAEGGVRVVDEALVRATGVTLEALAAVEAAEGAALRQLAQRLRAGRPRLPLRGRVAVIVDDGVATGATARAAGRAAQAQGAARVILAVPIATPVVLAGLRREMEVVCVESPRRLEAVGSWYADFSQTSDDEVVALLDGRRPPAVG